MIAGQKERPPRKWQMTRVAGKRERPSLAARKINEDETKILMTGAIAVRSRSAWRDFCMGELLWCSRRAPGWWMRGGRYWCVASPACRRTRRICNLTFTIPPRPLRQLNVTLPLWQMILNPAGQKMKHNHCRRTLQMIRNNLVVERTFLWSSQTFWSVFTNILSKIQMLL